jgi:hypothetical protein
MPVILSTLKALRTVRNLSFCYLCGGPLENRNQTNRDHVPPSGVFAAKDRDLPLILPTHPQCNQRRSPEDQAIGQLVGVLHGRAVNQTHNKLRVAVDRFDDGNSLAVLSDIDLRQIIRRWIRGFHAALYNEFLPGDASFATYIPLPEGKRDGDKIKYVPFPEALSKFVGELKRNRAARNMDRIVCRNGKCRYECVWSQADNGRWICIYCLDIYNWINLGDTKNFPARGCVGCYRRPSGGVPRNASNATRLIFCSDSSSSLDPFA